MRKWLFFLLVLSVIYALSKVNTKRSRARFPLLKRIDWMITALVWVLTISFVLSFLYWLYTQIF